MTITTIGIDLAKNVFAVHGVDHAGKTVLVKPRVSRAALPELIASLPPCVIGMEACSGAHYWARLFRTYGHEPRLMAPKFVSPYRMAGKSGKNDAADAQAICEAVLRPQMRFVPVKDEEQQAMLCLHRTRQGFMEEKTAIYNRIRGLISEFGVIGPQSTQALRHMVHEHKTALPEQAQLCVGDLLEHIDRFEAKITEYDRLLTQTTRRDPRSQQLMKLKGIGPRGSGSNGTGKSLQPTSMKLRGVGSAAMLVLSPTATRAQFVSPNLAAQPAYRLFHGQLPM
ncbi:transposase [Aeromonas salmonicida subsp. salmonicida]|nr:transposase [Aeromonas salmonicida subsp. salmonicida]